METLIQSVSEIATGQETEAFELSNRESGQFAQIDPTVRPTPINCQEAVGNMTDERLDRYIVGHLVGLKKNLLALAEGLAEKKARLARKGCDGQWSPYVKYEVGMSVSWADRLVRNWNLYLKLGVRVRKAAEQARVNITKPAVVALLQSYNAEFLTVEPSEERFAACILDLQEAGKRQQNTARSNDATESDSDASETVNGSDGTGEDVTEQEEKGDEGNGDDSDQHERTVSLHFTSQQGEEFDELIAGLKTRMDTKDRPNIVLFALRHAAQSFKPKQETPQPRASVSLAELAVDSNEQPAVAA